MVSAYVPAGPDDLAVSVKVLVPPPLTDDGLKVAVTPAGNPVIERPTVPAKPPDGVTVTIDVPVGAVRRLTATVVGLADSENSPCDVDETTSVTDVVWTSDPLVPVMVSG